VSGRVAILGPGAVGGMLAVRLALAGREVVCVARPGTAAAIARDGISLAWQGTTLHARPRAAERLEEPVELLLVCVKAHGLADAAGRVDGGAIERGIVVPLLNGVEHVERLRRRFGDRVVAATIGRLEAYREGPTAVVQTTALPLVTVASGSLSAGQLAVAVDHLRVAGVDVEVAASEQDVLWEKLARLAPLAAVTAAAQRPVGELRADPVWRRRLARALEEACAVAAAAGATVSPDEQWAIIEAMQPGLTTSTARDVAAGRPSELDAIVGAVARAGRRLGVPAPELEALLSELDGR